MSVDTYPPRPPSAMPLDLNIKLSPAGHTFFRKKEIWAYTLYDGPTVICHTYGVYVGNISGTAVGKDAALIAGLERAKLYCAAEQQRLDKLRDAADRTVVVSAQCPPPPTTRDTGVRSY